MTQSKMLEFVFRPVTLTSIFMDFLKNTFKIIKRLNSILLWYSFLSLDPLRVYFLYAEQRCAISKIHLKWLMTEKAQKIEFFKSSSWF